MQKISKGEDNMAIKPVSGEIRAQVINDNLSYLESLALQANGGPIDEVSSVSELNNKYPNGANGIVLVAGVIYLWNGASWFTKGTIYNQGILANLSIKSEKVGLRQITESKLPYLPAIGETGINIFNKNTVSVQKTLDVNGIITENPYPEIGFNVSDFISVLGGVVYARTNTDTAWEYDQFGVPIKKIVNASFVTDAKTKYIRTVIRTEHLETYMLVKGYLSAEYAPYKIISDGKNIKDKSVPITALENPVPVLSAGKNLFNKDTIVKNTYISYSTGKRSPSTSFWSSDFISVSENESYYKYDLSNQQYAFYTDKTLDSFIVGEANGNLIVVPENAKYLIVTSENKNLDNFQLEKGVSFTGYENYGNYIQENQLLPSIVEKINNPKITIDFKIQLPVRLFLTKGEEYQIHWRNVITNFDKLITSGVSVRLQEIIDTAYAALGKTYDDFWTYTPSEAINKKIEIRITDDETQDIIDVKVIDLIISDKLIAEKRKTIVTVGDSFTDGYGISKYLHDFVTSDSKKTLNMIGLNETDKSGVFDDAWSGYGYQWYHSMSKGYLRHDRPLSDAYWDDGWGENEVNGWETGQTYADLTNDQRARGFTKNEFYNPVTKKFDFSYYMSHYMSNQSIDAFVSLLGLNDAIWQEPQTLASKLVSYKLMIDSIIDSVKTYNPDVKILLGLVTPQQKNDSFINSYGATFLTASRAKKSQEIWNQFMLDNYDERIDDNIIVMATNAHFDAKSGLISDDIKPVKFDQAITKKVTTDVHPTEIGAKYIADTVRNVINGVLF